MIFDLKKIAAGAIMGLAAAIAFDLQKFGEADGQAFDWGKAVARWVKGALTGATGAAGLGAV